jgi:hypothetical protein
VHVDIHQHGTFADVPHHRIVMLELKNIFPSLINKIKMLIKLWEMIVWVVRQDKKKHIRNKPC